MPVARYGRVAIVGVGLMGGSIGKALLSKSLAREVVGVFRRQQTLDEALAAGAVTHGYLEPAAALDGAEVVLLATGVSGILEYLDNLPALAPAGALVTDVGSTKQAVTERMALVFGGRPEVLPAGSHPLYGSHRYGPAAGALLKPDGQLALLTPVAGHPKSAEAVERAGEFWRLLGMRTIEMSAEEHDRLLAASSHLPHLVAYALAAALPEAAEPLAASGFLDATRLALSRPETWRDIFSSNRRHLLAALAGFKEALGGLEAAIGAGDTERLAELLGRIQQRRIQMEQEKAPHERLPY